METRLCYRYERDTEKMEVLIMKEVRDFEERVWKHIAMATDNRDPNKIKVLTAIAQDIVQIKEDAKKIEDAINGLEDRLDKLGISPNVTENVTESGKSVSWKVTTGDIAQSVLSTMRLKKAGLIPLDGSPFEVQTSLGQVFETDELKSENTLREKKKIKEFYQGEGIEAGDEIVWTEMDPYRYRLARVS
jgi:hypothetical protein